MRKIQPGTDLYVTLTGCQDAEDDSYFNSASVNVFVEDISGNTVVASQSLSYVTLSNGNYSVTLDKTLFDGVLNEGQAYAVFITGNDSTTGAFRTWKMVVEFAADPVD